MSVAFPRAPQARAKKISTILVMFIWKIPFKHPLREARVKVAVHDPLERLDGYGAPLDPTRGSRLAPSDRMYERLPVRFSKAVKFV